MLDVSEEGGELRENRHHSDFQRDKQTAEMLRQRIVLVIAGFLILFIALTIRATDASLTDVDNFKTSNGAKKLREHRPEIVDRNGELIATNLRVASVYANPQEIAHLEKAASKLLKALPDLKIENLRKDLSRDSKFAWIKRNITPQEQQAIINLGIPGVYFSNEDKRVYPSGRLLAHTLGYVDIDSNGIAGVERFMDNNSELETGESLQLSIDLRVQHVLYDELSKQFEKFKAAGATAIIADVNSGEVIGMVSLPDFDPNFPNLSGTQEKFNISTLGSYEMGSTFKTITTAMAFDYGTSKPDRVYDATNSIRVGGHNISDYHAKKRPLTVTEVMMYSSNIGAAKMGMEVGATKMQEFLKKLGFYKKTELELSELGRPQFPKTWRELNVATISFGHGFAITPAHLVKGYIPIVNGGISVPLTLLKRNQANPVLGERVMSEKSSHDTTNILREIVIAGSGKNADAEGYLVGGKTGTAEKITDGRYDKGKLMSSFIATFPTSKPKYVILVIFDDPKEEQKYVRPTGGITAAPVVKNVVSRIGPILGIKPIKLEKKDGSI
jgi:cell division protein FtsI (penicillin-binding protein 3)